VEERNLTVVRKFPAEWTATSREAAARELIALQPDALLCCSTLLTRAALAQSQSVPVVFVWVADPVLSGIAKGYGRPGGNATGVSMRYFELATAGSLGFELARADGRRGVRAAIDGALQSGANALVILDPLAVFGRFTDAKDIAGYSIERRVPLVGTDVETCELGGLISYATNLQDDLRRGADLLARVLRGEKPADLPVDQAAQFELAVNLGTAHRIEIRVPLSILVRANRVIQ
jgi:putative tryptophan/tyrosine transport system substrate-binding protein